MLQTELEKTNFLIENQALLKTNASEKKYVSNYIGSKRKLVDWIWANTPDDVSSVLDAFSGSAAVAYMYKTKGLKVITNDRLKWSWHIARAIVENNNQTISEHEIDMLLLKNPNADSFVRDNYKGLYFYKGIHKTIDMIRSNCEKLYGYKKDIALFALARSCLLTRGSFAFSFSKIEESRKFSPEEFRLSFKKNIIIINSLIFDNKKKNKAFNSDVNFFLKKNKADVAYFDPPYVSKFSNIKYENSYHFLEGLMTNWNGIKIDKKLKTRKAIFNFEDLTKQNIENFFRIFLFHAEKNPYWLISYRNMGFPSKLTIKKLVSELGRKVIVKSKKHLYTINKKGSSEANEAIERLFICNRK